MKKLMAIILCTVMLLLLLPIGVRTVNADDRYLEISETNFPDAEFRNWIIDNLDVSGDAGTGYYMTKAQAEAVTVIECGNGELASLKGIEHFANLEELYCDPFTFSISGALTSVDLSANTKLKVVDLSCNHLGSIDVTKLTDLEELSVGYTEIKTLDVTKNTKLARLTINATGLTTIDLSQNPLLVWLDLCDAPIPKLDISGCPNMMAYYRAGERVLDLPYLAGKHVYGEGDEFVPYNFAFSDGTTVKTVTVHATAVCGETSVGDVAISPEGIIFPGEQFTLTAPDAEGYAFIGWFDAMTNEKLAETKTYTVSTQEEEVSFVAEYTEASGQCGDNLDWEFDDNTGTLTITGTGDMWDFDEMDAEVRHTRSTEMGDFLPWRAYLESITSVVIEDGVTGIGCIAFADCTEIQTVSIPNSVIRIGREAFWNCASLKSVDLPANITTLEERVFGYSGIQTLVIPDGVTKIGDCAFLCCRALTTITIPVSVTVIESRAFEFCNALTDVYYNGTKAQKAMIEIDTNDYGNDWLLDATWHYAQVENEPGWQVEGDTAYYYDEEGEPQPGWLLVDGKWFYFDEEGALQTGWILDDGKWYYLEPAGEDGVEIGVTGTIFRDGWLKVEGRWYFFNPGGHIARNTWKEIPDKSGTWYYFSAGGQMVTGWQKLGKSWYYFNPGGTLVTGWRKTGQYWYYLGNGAMRTGWQELSGKWYYFRTAEENPEGAMVTGEYTIKGKTYTFDENGVWIP